MQLDPNTRAADESELRLPRASAESPDYAQLRADVAARLGRACADMTPETFDALVNDVCAMKVRWAQRSLSQRDD